MVKIRLTTHVFIAPIQNEFPVFRPSEQSLSYLLGALQESTTARPYNEISSIPKELDKEVQTDAFIVYPYEHLFSVVLPQPTQNNRQTKVN